MTYEQFRAGLDQQQNAAFHSGALLGFSPRIIRLSIRIEEALSGAESRAQLAAEDPAMAKYHHRCRAEYIADARALINTPDGREAYRLYRERVGNV